MGSTLRNEKTSASIRLLALAATLSLPACVLAAGEWKIETVDTQGRGSFTSLKVDSSGNVHIAYVPEIDGHPLKYAFWDHAIKRWFSMKVAGISSFCTLVLDSKQYPKISYADHGTGSGARLRYTYWDGTAWQTEAISPKSDGVVGYYTSIALDAKDRPSFSYYEYMAPGFIQAIRLRSVFRTDNEWEVRMVDPAQGSGKFNSMAVDSKGHPHIAYANVKAETESLRYASWDGQTWKTEILEGGSGPVPIFSVALILDKNDNPHIAYSDVQKSQLKYATKNGGVWQSQIIDSQVAGYPDRNGITLDSQGNPYISYYDAKHGTLKVAFRKNGQWLSETVDRDLAGFTSSIGMDNDTLWVSYGDDSEKSLKAAHRPIGPVVSSQRQVGAQVAKGK